jgi:hypothetical protein
VSFEKFLDFFIDIRKTPAGAGIGLSAGVLSHTLLDRHRCPCFDVYARDEAFKVNNINAEIQRATGFPDVPDSRHQNRDRRL